MSRTLASAVLWTLAFGGCAKSGTAPEAQEPVLPPDVGTTSATDTAATPVRAEPSEPSLPPPVGGTVIYHATPAPPAPPTPAQPVPEQAQPAVIVQTEQVAIAAPALNDAQITKILECVDNGEIEQAKVAQKKLQDKRVKQFAKHMIQQHTKSEQKDTSVAKKENITPSDSPIAEELTGKANHVLEELKAADPASIDSLYIDAQARQHQEVLDLIDGHLLPSANDEKLRSLLGETRAMVQEHLAKARELQQAVASATPPPSATTTR